MFVPQEQRSPGVKIGKIEATINDAEQLLRRTGWVGGNPLRLGCPQVCAAIALARSTINHDVEYFRAHVLMLQAAHIQTGKQWAVLSDYNDADGRTVDEIWGLFRIARELAQNNEA